MKKHSRRKTPLEGGGADECWPESLLAPTLDKNHDYEAHDYDRHYSSRSSVLSKVKDKAMIWKRISRRSSYNDASTPEWGVSLQDEFSEEDNEDPDQIFSHPSPNEQSGTIKEGAIISRPKRRSIPEIYQRHVLEDKAMKSNGQRDEEDKEVTISRTLTRTVTRTLTAPAYAVASGAQLIASIIQDVVVSGTSVASSSLHQIIDKGSSLSKGNVVEKGEQEEEKVVCCDEMTKGVDLAKKGANQELNTPSKNEELNTGVREKVREAVSSIIENELVPSTTNTQQVSGDEDHQSQRILLAN
ncbi:hypothetical protein Scep_015846 [Stephania cephalantha]|uniref:Uncharacterized protein n=1 Tax=Stephania cephalantha TaxID=152367 RepID=A0AAP0P372_9MAGN